MSNQYTRFLKAKRQTSCHLEDLSLSDLPSFPHLPIRPDQDSPALSSCVSLESWKCHAWKLPGCLQHPAECLTVLSCQYVLN